MSKILLDDGIHEIDMSDGCGSIPFGMNGVGGMTIVIDGKQVTSNGFIQFGRPCLDGKVLFRRERLSAQNSDYDCWTVKQQEFLDLSNIHKFDRGQTEAIPKEDRIKNVMWGLNYQRIQRVNSGYQFGKELTFSDFCVRFTTGEIDVFKSSHGGFHAPTYLELSSVEEQFNMVYSEIVLRIYDYFDLPWPVIDEIGEKK